MVRASSFAKAVGLGTLLLLNAPSLAHGQTITITGRVVDGVTLAPIVDAIVTIQEDPKTVAVTDSTGRYSIAIPRPDVILVFSALGFTEQKATTGGRRIVNIPLVPRPLLWKRVVTENRLQERMTISGPVDSLSGSDTRGNPALQRSFPDRAADARTADAAPPDA